MSSILDTADGFEWDKGNQDKNWGKHQVSQGEIEESFFNEPLIIAPDHSHSAQEVRWHCLTHTNKNRLLFISFTVIKSKIRVISAHDQNKKERSIYEKA